MTDFQSLRATSILVASATVSFTLALGVAPSRLMAQQTPPTAPDQEPAQNAADRLPGKIYVQASFERRGENGQTEHINSILAVDPNTGTFENLGLTGHGIRVSPDGKRYVVAQLRPAENGESKSDLHVFDAKQFETLHVVENAGAPAWSGDGKRLIYNVGKMGEEVGWRGKALIVDLNTKEVRKTSVPNADEVDDWSAEGDWLVTVSDRHPPFGSGYQLYAMHPDGSDERRLTKNDGLNCYPRFRPGSNQIVYHHQGGGVDSLRLVDIDGKHDRELIKSEEGRGAPEGACWSPDGKWLAVGRFDWSINDQGEHIRSGAANDRLEIISATGESRCVLNLEGITQLTWLGHPDWR